MKENPHCYMDVLYNSVFTDHELYPCCSDSGNKLRTDLGWDASPLVGTIIKG